MHNKFKRRKREVEFGLFFLSYLADFPDGLPEEALHDPGVHPHHAVRGPADAAVATVLVDGGSDLKLIR